ncbi:vitelline membrane outer layer protein 1-like [Python bivittatus]|uniref:Vitelline membrane outer layer protein 1-like n=1 Tax=Python bivittatus TaxID=176946 RepID=A0A9F5MYX0_PYTBI|nr:vitelline membrane outer layer protein 1-like [Python bivittatus]
MDLTISIWIFLILPYCLLDSEARKYEATLQVPNGGRWGVWAKAALCPMGYANGFQLKVQPPQTIWADDTGLNSIRLRCTDGTIIESMSGRWGHWTEFQKCPKGNLVSFSLNMEEHKGLLDDIAVNNIQFSCEDGTVLTGQTHNWGSYGPWSKRCPVGFICGIQTKIEEESQGDNASLNDIKFFCCA